MIEVRTRVDATDGHCQACEGPETRPLLIVLSVSRPQGQHRTGSSTGLCREHARDLLNGLAAMYCSATGESIRKVLGFEPTPRARMRR